MDLAGLDPGDGVFQIAGPMSTPSLIVPATLRLCEDSESYICWREDGRTLREDTSGCFAAFLKLSQASDEQVLSFCQKWGVLNQKPQTRAIVEKIDVGARSRAWSAKINEYQDEETNDLLRQMAEQDQEWAESMRFEGPDSPYRNEVREFLCEPVNAYRLLAQQVHAFLSIACDLFVGRKGSLNDWAALLKPAAPDTFRWSTRLTPNPPIDFQKHYLAQQLTRWIGSVGLTPMMVWQTGPPTLVLSGYAGQAGVGGYYRSTLRNAEYEMFREMGIPVGDWMDGAASLMEYLTLKLVGLMSGRGHLVRCSVCGRVFLADRKPRVDRHPLCSDKTCRSERRSQNQTRYLTKRANRLGKQ